MQHRRNFSQSTFSRPWVASRSGALRSLILLAGLLAFSGPLSAETVLLTLIAPGQSIQAETDASIGLLIANPNAAAANFTPPPLLDGRLLKNGQSWPIQLTAVRPATQSAVPAGGFVNQSYTFRLPADAQGQLILEVTDGLPQPLRAVLAVSARPSAEPNLPPEFPATPIPLASNRTAAATLQRSFIDHFTALDPVYFIYGTKAPNAKFQFSFKYRLLTFDDGAPESPESTVQFGYTQRSLWDVNASSSPFYDTSYMPSLFYQLLAPAPRRSENAGGVTWLGFQTGYQHESNGQASTASRSLNDMFLRTGVVLGRPDSWHAIVQARIFDYVGGLSDNPRIKDYRGYGDWQIVLAKGNGPSLTYLGRAGKDFNHFTGQFDLNIPVKTKFLNFATYFLIQYFEGYGESLRAYTSYSNTVRGGISLVR